MCWSLQGRGWGVCPPSNQWHLVTFFVTLTSEGHKQWRGIACQRFQEIIAQLCFSISSASALCALSIGMKSSLPTAATPCPDAGDEVTLPQEAVDSISGYILVKTATGHAANGQLECLVFTNSLGYAKLKVTLLTVNSLHLYTYIHSACGSEAWQVTSALYSKWKREFKGSSCFNCVWLVKTREYLALSCSIGMLKPSQGSRQPTRPIESCAWILGIASRDVEEECPPPLKFNRDSDWRPESWFKTFPTVPWWAGLAGWFEWPETQDGIPRHSHSLFKVVQACIRKPSH